MKFVRSFARMGAFLGTVTLVNTITHPELIGFNAFLGCAIGVCAAWGWNDD